MRFVDENEKRPHHFGEGVSFGEAELADVARQVEYAVDRHQNRTNDPGDCEHHAEHELDAYGFGVAFVDRVAIPATLTTTSEVTTSLAFL